MSLHDKPFRGVIRDWGVQSDRVYGVCVYYTGPVESVVPDHAMCTSRIIGLADFGSFSLLETINSVYVLVHPYGDTKS